MDKNKEILFSFVNEGRWKDAALLLSKMNEVDAALLLEKLSHEDVLTILRLLDKDQAAEIFSNLPDEMMAALIQEVTGGEIRIILDRLAYDDAADMLSEVPANIVRRILQNTGKKDREMLNKFLSYAEDSAGSVMTGEYIALKLWMKVSDALSHIRRNGRDSETIYTCYVTDDVNHLIGVVSVRSLLLSDDDEPIGKLMEKDVIFVETSTDREEASRILSKYDLLALPVTDSEKRMVGIITVDDVLDVIDEEVTEDFEKMAAMAPSDRPYLKSSIFSLARNRFVWLLVLMVSGMITGGILSKFENAFSVLPVLVTFIPMLTDTGGNAGSQSSTMVIRGIALDQIGMRDVIKVFRKEFGVAIIVGFGLAFVNFLRIMLFGTGGIMVALTVAISLYATVIIAKTIGGILPLVAKACRLDPAIMASPLITTMVDAFSLVIYFSLAVRILGI